MKNSAQCKRSLLLLPTQTSLLSSSAPCWKRARDETSCSAYGPTLTLADGAKLASRRSLPITNSLYDALTRLVRARIGEDWERDAAAPLLRNRRGQPVTRRYLETTAARVREFNPAIGS